ncbi:uncharacterized protein RJT21DRAFT_114154 [Scheffersomyces amazonensis]|uniref:uncharacterized protein n=1 Tax=Scheffersomyces amazonensis TaxID=1078765 RepID=UPI00315CA289
MTELTSNSNGDGEVITNSAEKWFASDKFIDIEEKNIYPNVTVFNRKLYTFGESKEVFIKFSRINSSIPTQDEITYLDTRSCMIRISQDRYIVIISNEKEEEEFAVIGELSARYITKNNLNQYGSTIYDANDYRIVGLSKLYDPATLTADVLIDAASRRITSMFEKYMADIRQ